MSKNFDLIINSKLDQILAEKFTRYSKYIIQNRAIPDVRDGLKPVQRRILYSMWQLGLKNTKNYKKSARVVGDVIGKFHPHGDSSIYDALVRLSQEWKINIPLVEMHGNKGSIDDDPPAAMRYTEVRLAQISEHLLELLSKNVVNFYPNFDDSEKEPTVLPAIFPNLLINGAIGIASGFATEIPPHNLVEVIQAVILMIKNPLITNSQISKVILGPDFPTGGIVYGKAGILDAFETGKGKIQISSSYKISEKNKQKVIEISSIPFGISKANLIQQIDTIRFEEKISGIKEVIDQSDQNGVLIFVELEKDANAELILNYLLQKTDMQIYYSYNSVAICNNSPKLLSVKQMIAYFLEHLRKVKLGEFNYELFKSKKRLEIIEGFLKVADITNEVIEIIRKSDNSKAGVIADLVKYLNFTEVQAEAIASMRLYRLSKIEQQSFLNESKTLAQNIEEFQKLIENKEEFDLHLISMLENFAKIYGSPRKTKIVDKELQVKINHQDLIKDEQFYFWVSKSCLFKKMNIKNHAVEEIEKIQLPSEDFFVFQGKINQRQKGLFLTNKGDVGMLLAHQLEELTLKNNPNNLQISLGLKNDHELINSFFVDDLDSNHFLLFITKFGYAKRMQLKEIAKIRPNNMINCFKPKEGDELISIFLENKLKNIVLITSQNRALKISASDVPIYGRISSGVKILKLQKTEKIVASVLIDSSEEIAVIDNYSRFEKIASEKLHFGNRTIAPKSFDSKLDFSIIPKSVEIYSENLQVFDFDTTLKVVPVQKFINFDPNPKKNYKLFLTTDKNNENLPNFIEQNQANSSKILKTKLQEISEIDINLILEKIEKE
ncbi:DNA topoisomerase (ATP-hydrolyzing) [Mesomycoplasma ovipneumoniae]|uniref:DNA topoisomerase (ATP-hydrolyzing) n=1 Tax=Mesomycoplasma ovipneumoniae TaxID=29562 RepID=UPI002963D91D|nr:DNA topoisomerase (ATP-hydrolyzing) [Mesomycoplasma ovipneumoniae]MDW2906817.1 DNA topoisomerase (ATP-hydrolyzing) [Mesomycoplasma ovipneumoniae]MDW2913198.1 DNA topoisomerase (ATP-hydrolyzing) [Mesomycoplasma ovipneumoniae]MDW2915371.1 DNA topoisomerase (ATP-hydrolyzing) [Mesomycoplasma ovipneumoniae]MDW2918897.1 DNA topoisomerase (ATP-hydrolyzing) [Mesomycoplasma ovipneumoniae]